MCQFNLWAWRLAQTLFPCLFRMSSRAPAGRYGLYVLCVEILGAIATLLYGVNLVWDPVIEAPEMDPTDPSLPLVRILCCLRSVAWVLRSCQITTAWIAQLPRLLQAVCQCQRVCAKHCASSAPTDFD